MTLQEDLELKLMRLGLSQEDARICVQLAVEADVDGTMELHEEQAATTFSEEERFNLLVDNLVLRVAVKWLVHHKNNMQTTLHTIFHLTNVVLKALGDLTQEGDVREMTFEQEMGEVLRFHYGLSEVEAREFFFACRPDLLREFLEHHLIDAQEHVLSEKMAACPPDEFAQIRQVTDFLVSAWRDYRRNRPSS